MKNNIKVGDIVKLANARDFLNSTGIIFGLGKVMELDLRNDYVTVAVAQYFELNYNRNTGAKSYVKETYYDVFCYIKDLEVVRGEDIAKEGLC